jgi:hypothetical protein
VTLELVPALDGLAAAALEDGVRRVLSLGVLAYLGSMTQAALLICKDFAAAWFLFCGTRESNSAWSRTAFASWFEMCAEIGVSQS